MSNEKAEPTEGTDCVIPSHALPAEELGKYSIERDPHREKEIAAYVES